MLHRWRFQLWGFGTHSCLNEIVGLLAAFNEKWKHFSAVPDLCVTELFIWCFFFLPAFFLLHVMERSGLIFNLSYVSIPPTTLYIPISSQTLLPVIKNLMKNDLPSSTLEQLFLYMHRAFFLNAIEHILCLATWLSRILDSY